MKQQARRLAVESLENRWCPALTATLSGATLTISGTADTGPIAITQDSTTAGTITVTDGGTTVGSGPFTGVSNVRLNLTSADDTVTLDLGGQTLPGYVLANLGAGANNLTVQTGTLTGTLAVLEDSPGAPCGPRGTRTTPTADTAADTITLASTATVGNLGIQTGQGGATVTVDGDVTGDLAVDAFFRSGSSNGTTLTVNGTVDGNLLFAGSNLADKLTLNGSVGKSLLAATGAGDDTVTINGAVTRNLFLDTGAGKDAITLGSVVGGRTNVDAGAGDDTLTITSSANLGGRAVVNMGAGADTVTLDDSAVISTLLLNGGSGSDAFVGTAGRTGLTLVSF
jgi:fibronectin-binding autotransporter adhesin